jgi:hypothetical protein
MNINYGTIISRADGSYIIEKNGYPYHVPANTEGEWAELWAEVDAYAQAHPEQVTEEPLPPPPPDPTPEELAARRKAEIRARIREIEYDEQPRCLREIALGAAGKIEQGAADFALQKLADLNAEIDALRVELKTPEGN